MKRVITAAEVEAVVRNGDRQLAPGDGALVTSLARDRAAALGVAILDGQVTGSPSPAPPAEAEVPPAPRITGWSELDVNRLALESKVRVVARRALLRAGRGLAELESIVAAVLGRLEDEAGPGCGCEARGGRR